MSKKYRYEEIADIVNSLGYRLISKEYKNNREKLIVKDDMGYYYFSTIQSLKNYKPKIAHKYNPYSVSNIKLWLKINNKSFMLVSEKYMTDRININFKCLKEDCGEEFKATWNKIFIAGQGCPFCAGVKVGLSNCLATKNSELAKEWHPTKNGDLTPWDVAHSSGRYIWWKCRECGHEWYTTVSHRKKGNGCSKCNESKGERIISNYFDMNNIEYISQKEFDGLIGLGNGNLSYDFFLSKYNLLIEYQGIQHEKSIDFKGKGKKHAEKQFKKQQEHDKRKKEYAQKHNIKLLEIWYYDFDNIEEILEKTLKSSFLIGGDY